MPRSIMEQISQVKGSLTYDDLVADYPLAQAETHGKLKQSESDGSVLTASPTVFTDSVNSPFSLQSIGDFIRILSGANQGTYRITGYTDASNAICASATFADESSIDYEVRQEQNLEDDLNYLRTCRKEVLGSGISDWFGDIPTYTNPKATNVPKRADLTNIAGNTTDAILQLYDKEVEGESVSVTDTEVTIADATQYADAIDKTGVPVADSGELDETNYLATIVELKDPETGSVLKAGGDGAVVFGRIFKGVEGTNIKIKFFTGTNDASATPYAWTADDPTTINVVYAERYTLTDLPEDVNRRKRILGLNEDAEVGQDIDDLQSFTGGSDGETRPTWTNTSATYPLDADPDNLETAINDINDAVGSRQYSTLANNIINDGDTITDSLEDLAEKLSDTDVEKIVELVTSLIPKNTAHTLPSSKTYTPDSADNGLHMDVYLNGQLLSPDTATDEVDYEETSTTQVTFRGNVTASAARPAILTYIIRKA
jgi:hypothetical protein